jgi:AraC-like DNA-binding protein
MTTESNSFCFKWHVPQRPLSDFVGLLWYWRGHESAYSKERVLPSGTVELVVKLGKGRASDAGISGPKSRYFVIERRTEDELLGVHFKQGGGFPFFNFPIAELHNGGGSLAAIWGEKSTGEMVELLHEALTIDEKFRLLEKWLMGAVCHSLEQHPAVSYAIEAFQHDPLLSSADMAEKVGFSQRRFIELFRSDVGLTPKLFCRVRRFQQVIRAVENREEVDWADVALSAGYYDQAHFIHDFQQFSGLTPKQYLPLRTGHSNHVKIHE